MLLRSGLCRVFAWLFLASVFGSGALAQLANIHVARKGDWSVDCSAEPQTHEKWCQVGVTLSSTDPPYAVEFNYVRDSRMFFGRSTVPLNGVSVRVDDHAPYALERCLANMCLLRNAPAERLLAEMRTGHKLLLRFDARPPMPGPLTVDLADFDAMYRAALLAPK